MAGSLKKELKVFERLENMTKHDSFDSAASFVRKFVNGNVDMNSTYQSIPEAEEEEEEEEEGVNNHSVVSYCSEEEDEDDRDKSSVSSVGKGKASDNDENGRLSEEESEAEEGDEHEDDDDEQSSQEWSGSEEEGLESMDESRSSSVEAGNSKSPGKAALGQYNTSYLLLSEIKRSLELQEHQLVREKKTFTQQKTEEEKKLESEKKQVEAQRLNLQRLITDYHKMKSSKAEHEQKVRELTEKLLETKLEMNKRISRWGDQQRRLENRVKALENENKDLKKQKSMAYRPALLKRPPLNPTQTTQSQKTKLPRRIHFADNLSSSSSNKSDSNPTKPTGGVRNKILKKPSTPPPPPIIPEEKEEDDEKENSQGGAKSQAVTLAEKENTYPREVCLSDDDADKTMPSDYVEVKHSCGTITRIAKDNKLIRHVMVNSDVMDEFDDCSVRYYYSELGFSQITYPNGDEIIEYDGGVLETHRADGTKIYTYSDGLVKLVNPTGSEEIYFPDGSDMKTDPNGTCTITWPSGQKEERTSTYTKRVYTNGTVKIKYTDGSEETRYHNGRVRRKDKNGQLVDDTRKKRRQKLDKVNKTA